MISRFLRATKWYPLLVGGLLGFTTAVPAAPNVWLLDTEGRSLGAFEALGGDWTLSVTPQASGFELVGESDRQTVPVPPASVGAVLVNDGSGVSPARSRGPAISFGGVGQNLGDLDSVAFAQAGILPAGGTFPGTVRIEVRALPAAGADPGAPLELQVEVDGVPRPSIVGTTAAPPATNVYLVTAGKHQVSAQAAQGMLGPVASASFTLVPVGSEDRDTDGDGIPDFVEADLGLNPLDARVDFVDSDGDGLSDFDELLRGSDPEDPNSLPRDTDGDGWSDFDETARGTNPNDPPELVNPAEPGLELADRPRVSRLMAVEYVLGGTVYADNNLGQVVVPIERVNLTDLYWQTRYDTATLPGAALLGRIGVSEAALPADLQANAVAALTDAGTLPPARVPAEFTQVVRASAAAGAVYRSWLPAVPDVTLADMPAWMQENGLVALDTPGWARLYQQYLSERLVRPVNLSIAPMDSRGLVLLESVLAWYAPEAFTGRILLGNPRAPAPAGTVPALMADLEGQIDPATGESRAVEDLLLTLEALAGEGGLLESFGLELDALFTAAQPLQIAAGDVADAPSAAGLVAQALGGTTELDAANLIQGASLDTLAVYLARLATTLSPEEQSALLALAPALFTDPLGDHDGDGVSNADELGALARHQTAVTAVDTDGDGYYDGFDPCPLDASNQCSALVPGTGDSDGDGVANFLDNCPTVANPDQADTGATGVGDVCRTAVVLESPATDLTVIAGMSVDFASTLISNDFVAPLTVSWDFAGVAPASTELVPGAIEFPTPGQYTVLFSARDANRALVKDQRTITVLGSVVEVSGTGVGTVEEGVAAQLAANATSTAGTILAVRWETGDGASLMGASVQHVYPSQGTYSATVEAVDINGFTATLLWPVTVTDSVPVASIGASTLAGPAPLTVQFSDQSTAWDGIVAREWDFGGGSGDIGATEPSVTFEAPGSYTVTLAVTDGDGSVELAEVVVVVGSAAQVPALPGPFRLLLLVAIGALVARQVRHRRAG